MKTNWDYTELADAYLKRPDYAPEAVDELLKTARVSEGARVCDVGAGVAHLTLMLAGRGLRVDAVEPNDAMRANGVKRTAGMDRVSWFEGTGESTGMADGVYALATFGSSFNVTDRSLALKETARILCPGGWFACLWNHRDLEDPIQAEIESVIRANIPGYDYGTRREDQEAVIDASGLFGPVRKITGRVVHRQKVSECVAAWRSHATLQRQAGDAFGTIVSEIEEALAGRGEEIEIPYETRVWAAPKIG